MLAPTPNRSFLKRLPDELAGQIVKGAQRISYPPGSTIPIGDEAPWMEVVQSGCLRLYLVSPDGSQVTLRYLRSGDLIGALDADNLPRAFQSLGPTEVLHLDAARFFALVQKEPAVAWELMHEAASVIGATYRAFGIRTFGSIRMRVAHAILERAKACGGANKGTVVAGTQQELAMAAGTVREVVAPALHALRNEGVIDIRRGAVVVLDPVRLADEADPNLGLNPAAS